MAECEEETSKQMDKNINTAEKTDSESGEDESDAEFYEVEKILGKSKTNSKCMYKVRWRGYTPDDDTWEPIENLESCLDLIEEFEKEREQLKSKRREERSKRKALMIGASLPHDDKSSSDDYNLSQENVSTLKDTFWKDLEDGKVNVFATDMYSKVKGQGRMPKSTDLKKDMKRNKTSPSPEHEPKPKKKRLLSKSHGAKMKKGKIPAKKKKRRRKGGTEKKKIEDAHTEFKTTWKQDESSNQSSSAYSISSVEHKRTAQGGADSVSVVSSSQEGCDSSLCPQSDGSSYRHSESIVSSSQGEPSEVTSSQVDSVMMSSQESCSVEKCTEVTEEEDFKDMPKLDHFTTQQEDSEDVAQGPVNTGGEKSSCPEYVIISDSSESDTDTSKQKMLNSRDSETQRMLKGKASNKCISDQPLKRHCPLKSHDSQSSNHIVKQSTSDAPVICLLDEPIKRPSHESKKQPSRTLSLDSNFSNSSSKNSERNSSSSNSKLTKHSESAARDSKKSVSATPESNRNASVLKRRETIDIPGTQPLNNIWNSTFLPLLPESSKSQERGDDLGFEIELDDLDWEQFEKEACDEEPVIIADEKMQEAIMGGDFQLVQRALSSGKMYDVDGADSSGATLLMHAARQGYDDIAELLILSGANINAQQKNGLTALMLACEEAEICTVSLLVEFGANINLMQSTGETALMKAARRGHKQIAKFLLENGSNFSDYTTQGNTALTYASMYNNTDVEEILSEHSTRLKTEFDKQVCMTLNNTARIICGLFPLQCFPLSESNKVVIPFKHELQPMTPGVGYLLFIAHARITGQEIKCRFYGQCAVKSAFLNGVQQPSLTEEANFVMSFCPLNNGRNEIIIHTIPSPISKVKLVVCAYKAQLLDPACQKSTGAVW